MATTKKPLLLLALALGASCARLEKSTTPGVLEALPPNSSELSLVEAVSSALELELGTPAQPQGSNPDKIYAPCARWSCRESPDGVILEKSVNGCRTPRASTHGTSRITATDAPGLSGCATPEGPALFRAWPPRAGILVVDQDLSRTSESSAAIRISGRATLHFSASKPIGVELRQSAAASAHEWSFDSQAGALALSMPEFNDAGLRTFQGELSAFEQRTGSRALVRIDALVYQKSRCCHPIAGRLTVTSAATNGAYRIEFREAPCGKAVLIDSLGVERELELDPC